MASKFERGHKYERVAQVISALDEAYRWIMTGVSPVPYPYYEWKYKPSWEEEEERNRTIAWIQGDMDRELHGPSGTGGWFGWKAAGIVEVPNFNGMDYDMKLALCQMLDKAMCIHPTQISEEWLSRNERYREFPASGGDAAEVEYNEWD